MSDAQTLADLKRQAARRGLCIERRRPVFIVRLTGSRIPIFRTRELASAVELVESFRGGGR